MLSLRVFTAVDGLGIEANGSAWTVVGSVLLTLFAVAPLASWLTGESDRRSSIRQLERWTTISARVTPESPHQKMLQKAIDDRALTISLKALAPPKRRLRFVAWYLAVLSVALFGLALLGVASGGIPEPLEWVYLRFAPAFSVFGLVAAGVVVAMRTAIRVSWVSKQRENLTGEPQETLLPPSMVRIFGRSR